MAKRKKTKANSKQPKRAKKEANENKETNSNLPVDGKQEEPETGKHENTDEPERPDIVAEIRKRMDERIADKMRDERANRNSLLFYKDGFEDALTMFDQYLHPEKSTKRLSAKSARRTTAVAAMEAAYPEVPKMMFVPTTGAIRPPPSTDRPADLAEFQGDIYSRDDLKAYHIVRYQYAFSSIENKTPGQMRPKYILYPKNDQDVITAIKYARKHSKENVKIAVRTGGHQYSGASSTNGNSILLDMSETYLDFEEQSDGLIKTGISHSLREFNIRLGKIGKFVPHGQCSHVHLGGHAQTGGYGQLGRSFGLFADHIEKIRIITADKDHPIKEIERKTKNENEKNLFWAVLGGSPGNFGVLTHLWLRTYNDKDYQGSRGLKAVYTYSKERLKRILDLVVEMAEDEDFPRNYDLCVTVLSSSQLVLPHLWPNADNEMRENHPELYGRNDLPFWGPMILIYAQWVEFKDPKERYEDGASKWFQKIKDACGWPLLPYKINNDKPTNMSELATAWVFGNVREFVLPFEKRTYMTNWTDQLRKKEWSKWVSERINVIQSDLFNGCKLAVQIQHFGGNKSRFRLNADDTTAFSWRDSTICCVLDCFYDKPGLFTRGDPAKTAARWQQQNDTEARGKSNSRFCNEDRRVLWSKIKWDFPSVAAQFVDHQTRNRFFFSSCLCFVFEEFPVTCSWKNRINLFLSPSHFQDNYFRWIFSLGFWLLCSVNRTARARVVSNLEFSAPLVQKIYVQRLHGSKQVHIGSKDFATDISH